MKLTNHDLVKKIIIIRCSRRKLMQYRHFWLVLLSNKFWYIWDRAVSPWQTPPGRLSLADSPRQGRTKLGNFARQTNRKSCVCPNLKCAEPTYKIENSRDIYHWKLFWYSKHFIGFVLFSEGNSIRIFHENKYENPPEWMISIIIIINIQSLFLFETIFFPWSLNQSSSSMSTNFIKTVSFHQPQDSFFIWRNNQSFTLANFSFHKVNMDMGHIIWDENGSWKWKNCP